MTQVPNKITIHCSDSPNGKSVSMEEIRKWHLARGFDDIGYHLVIDIDGMVSRGRPLNVVGAHVEGHNTGNIGICLVGATKYSVAQFGALRYQLDSLFMCFPIPKWELYCHNQWDTAIKQGKTCPNMSINNLLYWYVTQDEKAILSYKL